MSVPNYGKKYSKNEYKAFSDVIHNENKHIGKGVGNVKEVRIPAKDLKPPYDKVKVLK